MNLVSIVISIKLRTAGWCVCLLSCGYWAEMVNYPLFTAVSLLIDTVNKRYEIFLR